MPATLPLASAAVTLAFSFAVPVISEKREQRARRSEPAVRPDPEITTASATAPPWP